MGGHRKPCPVCSVFGQELLAPPCYTLISQKRLAQCPRGCLLDLGVSTALSHAPAKLFLPALLRNRQTPPTPPTPVSRGWIKRGSGTGQWRQAAGRLQNTHTSSQLSLHLWEDEGLHPPPPPRRGKEDASPLQLLQGKIIGEVPAFWLPTLQPSLCPDLGRSFSEPGDSRPLPFSTHPPCTPPSCHQSKHRTPFSS